MGLLEKALEYKKEINRKGQVTLLDTIKGPAETEMLDKNADLKMPENNDLNTDESVPASGNELSNDLFELPTDDNYSPLDSLKEQKSEQFSDTEEVPQVEQQEEIKKKKKAIPSNYDSPNPLSQDDEPILPKDIDSAARTIDEDNKYNSPKLEAINEIVEIEPYIIPEESYFDVNLGKDTNDDQEPSINISETHENNLKYTGELGTRSPERFQKDLTLYEISKEISRSESKKALFEAVIFSVMGQIGTSSASIMIKNPENDTWVIANSSGLKSGEKIFSFESSTGIFKNLKKDILDIEDYKNNPEYEKYYRELSSTGTRLLIPWFFKGKVTGLLALGDKITDDDYTSEEKIFIQSVCESSAIELNKLNTFEKFKTDLEATASGFKFLQSINTTQEKLIKNNNIKNIKDIIISEFNKLGIINFSIFIHDSTQNNFTPVVTDRDEIHNPEKFIDETDGFISFINKRINDPRVHNFKNSEIIKSVFNENEIRNMQIFWVFPVKIGDQLIGFISIFKISDDLLKENKKDEVDNNFAKLSKIILQNIINIINIDPEKNKYIDTIGNLFKRINAELVNAKSLGIPLTLAIFSIKNYKRYGNLFGYEKAKELIDIFAGLIKSRLSETEFSARYDRNKILVILPGKDKKFVEQFANIIRSEIMQKFKKSEMQLLITFMLAEYPEDGDDLLSLIDSID